MSNGPFTLQDDSTTTENFKSVLEFNVFKYLNSIEPIKKVELVIHIIDLGVTSLTFYARKQVVALNELMHFD